MIQAILSIFTVAAALGLEVPALVAPFESADDCLIAAAKLNQRDREQLQEAGAGYVCLVLKEPTI